ICIGIGLLIAAGWMLKENLNFIDEAIQVEGQVIATPFGKYHPEVEFIADNKETIQFTQNGFHTGFEVGEKVHVLYLPHKQTTARIHSTSVIWGFPIVLFVGALLFLIFGGIKYANPNT